MIFDRFFNKYANWQSTSTFIDGVQFDAAFPVLKSLRVRTGGLTDRWHPLLQPNLPLMFPFEFGGHVTTAQLLGQEENLLPYLRDIQRLCREHPGRVEPWIYFRTDSLLFKGQTVLAAPWINMTATTDGPNVLPLLSRDDGDLHVEEDQVETEEMIAKGDLIYYHMFDNTSHKPLVNIHFPRAPFQAQLRQADQRLTTIVTTLCRELGVPNWHTLQHP